MREVTTRSIRQETRESDSEDEHCGSHAIHESCIHLRALAEFVSRVWDDGDSERRGSRMTGWTLFVTVFSRAIMSDHPTYNNDADSTILHFEHTIARTQTLTDTRLRLHRLLPFAHAFGLFVRRKHLRMQSVARGPL